MNANNVLYTPWKELKGAQNKKLSRFINEHLYPFSPYYRRLFDKNKINPRKIRAADDLKRIPFTSKRDFLEADSLDFLLQPDKELIKRHLPKARLLEFSLLNFLKGSRYIQTRLEDEYRPIFLTATAGTTNKPISFLYTGYDLKNLNIYGKRVLEVLRAKSSDRVVNLFPYAPHLAFWQTFFAGFAFNLFMLSTGGGKTLGTQGNIQSALKVKPQFLIGVPSYVYHVVKTARQENTNFNFLKTVVLGASSIPEGFKKKMFRLLSEMGSSDIKILGTYGFTEARCAWAECPTEINESSGYHVYPDKEIFEVIDPETGELKEDGQDGELVYTNIDARGSCVLRYRTGDLVKGGIDYSPCPYCGKTVPRISSYITRASNIKDINLTKIKGAMVNLNEFEHLLDNKEEIDEWQIEIIKKNNDPYEIDELILYISLFKEVNKDDFSQRLNQEVFLITEVTFTRINFVSHEEMDRKLEVESCLKAKKIADKRVKP